MSRTPIQPHPSSRHAATMSALTLALLAACGGGGSESTAPAGSGPTSGGGGTGATAAPSRSETHVEKGVYWERGAGLRPNLAHLIGAAEGSANVQSLSAQEQAWVRERAAAAGTAATEGSTKEARAGATLQATAVPRRTVTGLQTFIYHTATSTVLQPLDLSTRVIEALAPNGLGGFEVIPATAKRADGTYAIANVPEGAHWARLGTRYVWTPSGFVDWSQDLYGRADVNFAAASTKLQINAGNLAPWQTNDGLAWVVPQHGTSLQLPLTAPTIANAPRAGEVALGNFGLDLGPDTFFSGLLEAAKGDVAYLNQLVTQGTSGVRVLGRSMVLPPLTLASGSTTPVNSGFLDIAPSAKLQLRWDRATFARQANAVHPGATASSSGVAISAFATSPALGTPFDAYSLLEFDTLGSTDLDFGTLRYGHPFPADWNRVVDAFVVFTKNYLAPGATVSEPLVRGLSTSVLIDPATRHDARLTVAPGVTPPRAPLINGRTLFNNQLAVGTSPTLSWSAPESGTPDYYFIRVLELRLDGTRSALLQVARLTTAETSMLMPPGLLQAGKLYVITIAANKSGTPITQPSRNGLPFAFATLMSAIVSP